MNFGFLARNPIPIIRPAGVCDEERSERGIRVIRSLPPKRKRLEQGNCHRGRCGAPGGTVRSSFLVLVSDFFQVIARDPKAKCANGSGCKYIHDGTGATPTPTPADPLADRIAAAKAAIAPGTPPSLGKRAKPPTPNSSDDL
ncbi:hypothetical protein EMIHUDRAFT_196085 [Emiliania huxleyi CCMP1516]|uniref:C3H1-type domain-containing protein n=2 Tax=Emiliania huxleyi TaxID=2903 RepID=A0A0D3J3G1_EMIH1|nr:hypothetical protein EMIHUDRAFT_196085 [Emiliania huxleyi CCMP1516]EOD18046.1 hypothetical protein EMIHUDRAFT_196085 [Emiliania huxleyi CCMP1516]|eukprot:XP_005770475.1 hypothetical protein EMIHUDRAFT_196085 [Emiliania huxleyi CCMP1516]